MNSPLTPAQNFPGFAPNGLDGGWSSCGRFTSFEFEDFDDQVLFAWEKELLPGWTNAGVAVFIFENGTLPAKARIPGAEDSYFYRLPADIDKTILEFYLFPDESPWETYLFLRRYCDRIKLTWTVNEGHKKLEVYGNAGASVTSTAEADAVASFPDPVPILQTAAGGTSGVVASVDGTWTGESSAYETISITVDTAGAIGTAIIDWTWGSLTGTLTTSAVYQHIVNGIYIKWTDDGTAIDAADTWTIWIRAPQEWTSGRLANGQHTYDIGVFDQRDRQTLSGAAISHTLSYPPDDPAATNITVNAGAGTADVTFTAPTATNLQDMYIYKSWKDESIPHWVPVYQEASISSAQAVTHTVTDLYEGENVILAKVTDTAGLYSEGSNGFRVTLDSSLNEVSALPNPPYSLAAEMQTDGDVRLTAYVDASGDTATFYHDNRTGTMDYATSRGTAAITYADPADSTVIADNFQAVTLDLAGLTDGTYLFACRVSKSSYEESNTDVVIEFEVDGSTATAVSSLAASEVCS